MFDGGCGQNGCVPGGRAYDPENVVSMPAAVVNFHVAERRTGAQKGIGATELCHLRGAEMLATRRRGAWESIDIGGLRAGHSVSPYDKMPYGRRND